MAISEVRTQVYLPRDQHRALKREAERRAVSMAHLVREALAVYLGALEDDRASVIAEPSEAVWPAARGSWPSPGPASPAVRLPPELEEGIEKRAEEARMSKEAFIVRELEKTLARPTREELLERIARLPPVELDPPPAEVLREERGRR